MQKLTICVFIEFDPATHSAEAIDRAVSEKIEAAIRDDMPPGSKLEAIHAPEWAQDEPDSDPIEDGDEAEPTHRCTNCDHVGDEDDFKGDSILLTCPACFSDTVEELQSAE